MENENWEADWEVEQDEESQDLDMHPALRMSGTDYKLALIRLQGKK